MTIDEIISMTDLDRLPLHFIEGDTLMSNFDHVIDRTVEKQLLEGPYFSNYAGWDFNGNVWFGEGKWRCEIWRYRSYVETIVADSTDEIMREASEKYGSG